MGFNSGFKGLIDDLVHLLRIAWIKVGTEVEKVFVITILKLKMYVELFQIWRWTNKYWPWSVPSMYLPSVNCLPNWDTSPGLFNDISMHFQRMRLVQKGVSWRLEIDRFSVAVSCRHIFPYFHPPISLECLKLPSHARWRQCENPRAYMAFLMRKNRGKISTLV